MTRFRHLPPEVANRLMEIRQRRVGRPLAERPEEDLRVLGELMAEVLITAYHGIFHFGVQHRIFSERELGLAPAMRESFLREREAFQNQGQILMIQEQTLDRLNAAELLLEEFFRDWGRRNPFTQAFETRLGGFFVEPDSMHALRRHLRQFFERTREFLQRGPDPQVFLDSFEAPPAEENDPRVFLAEMPEGMAQGIFGGRSLPSDPARLSEFIGEALAQTVLRVHEALGDARIPIPPQEQEQLQQLRQWVLDTTALYRDLGFFPDILDVYERSLTERSLPLLFRSMETFPHPLVRGVLARLRRHSPVSGSTPLQQAFQLGNWVGVGLRESYLDTFAWGAYTGILRPEDFGIAAQSLLANHERLQAAREEHPLSHFSQHLSRVRSSETLVADWLRDWGVVHPLFQGLEASFPRTLWEALRPGKDRAEFILHFHRPERH